jgi:hypothetical protein
MQEEGTCDFKDAMKAAKGARAGVTEPSDAYGCIHWGVRDFMLQGMVEPCSMKYYLEEGNVLFGTCCQGCNKATEELEKKKCNPANRVYCYFCDEGNKPGMRCETVFCYPCLIEKNNQLDKEEEVAKRLANGDMEGRRTSNRKKTSG